MNGSNSNTTGEAEAVLKLKPAGANDRLPAWAVEELTRRGYVVFQVSTESNVVIQNGEPDEKSKIWFKADTNGIPTGSALIWNPATSKWGPVSEAVQTYVPPKRRYGQMSVAAGASQVNFNFESIGTTKYHLNLTPTTKNTSDAGGFNSPPGSVPTNYGWFVTNLGENTGTVNFFGVPTGGATYMWEVVEIADDNK